MAPSTWFTQPDTITDRLTGSTRTDPTAAIPSCQTGTEASGDLVDSVSSPSLCAETETASHRPKLIIWIQDDFMGVTRTLFDNGHRRGRFRAFVHLRPVLADIRRGGIPLLRQSQGF